MNELEKALKKVPKPKLTSRKKSLIKDAVLYQTKSSLGVGVYIRKLAESIKMDSYRRAMLKERIFALIDNTPQRRFVLNKIWVFHKKAVSMTLMALMVLGMFSFVNVDTHVVRAETFTTLDYTYGEVFVQRDGEFLEVSHGMKIYEGDKVGTGKDGLAVITYFDDSVTRLSSFTNLDINKLDKADSSYVDSHVEVSVSDGRLWSKVVNLVGDESSFTVNAMDVSAETKKAAFNVEIEKEKLEIEVFDRSVNVKKDKVTDTIVRGQKAVVNGDIKVEKIASDESNVAWVQDNLQSDEEHLLEVEKRLLVAKMESIGVDPEEDINFEKSLREKTLLLLTIDDVKKGKIELDLAEKDLIAAEVKLNDPNLTYEEKANASAIMGGFSERVEKFYDLIEEVSYTDEEYAQELKEYADQKLFSLKKDFSAIAPESPSYGLKDSVDSLLVFTADDESEKAKIKLEQSLDKLEEAENAAKGGNEKLAVELVEDNEEALNEAIEVIESLEGDDREELVEKASEYLDLAENTDENLKNKVRSLSGEPVVVEEVVVEEIVEEPVKEEVYGVRIEGDKPLPAGLD